MSSQAATTTATSRPRNVNGASVVTLIFLMLALGLAYYQLDRAGALRYDNGVLSTRLEAATTNAEVLRSELAAAEAEALELSTALARAQALAKAPPADAAPAASAPAANTTKPDPATSEALAESQARVASLEADLVTQEDLVATLEHELAEQEATITTLEASLADAEAASAGFQEQVAEAQGTITALQAEVEAAQVLPPPPAAAPLAPPPLHASNPYDDTHVDVPLEQYLNELLVILADDAQPPGLPDLHPLSLLYRLDTEFLAQGTVGTGTTYRLTEWHTLNEYGDLLDESRILIDAPSGTPALSLVQQALTATRGAAETNEAGHPSWEMGTKAVTLQGHPSNAARVTLTITDTFAVPETLQIYNRD